ncbi:MAG: sensor domain-containing diguanylate cyclase [Spirochaetaceae bacterium]|nr:sensor domain-containing diguanylate cyclase [Spirochaetaceae bacterium]
MALELDSLRYILSQQQVVSFTRNIGIFFVDYEKRTYVLSKVFENLAFDGIDWDSGAIRLQVHPEDKDRFDLFKERLRNSEPDNPASDTFRIAAAETHLWRWVTITATAVVDARTGAFRAVAGHLQDISEVLDMQEEIRDRLIEIESMKELIGAINQSLNFSETFDRIIKHLRRIIPFDRATAQSYDGYMLSVVAHYGYSDAIVTNTLTFPAKGIDNPAVRAIESQRPIICNDVEHDFPGFVNVNTSEPVRSWLGIPLVYEGKTIGLLSLDCTRPQFYTDKHVQLASSVADQIAIAFEHSRRHQKVTEAAMTDKLTGLGNRYALETIGQDIFQYAIDNEKPVSFLMLDIDHFKTVNDTYGHSYGDRVLREIASIIKKSIRDTDLAIRYGGEELLLILRDASAREAMVAAERLRTVIGRTPVDGERLLPTVSIGVYSLTPTSLDLMHEAIRKADLALYTAKESGRNRTRVWSSSPEFFVNL